MSGAAQMSLPFEENPTVKKTPTRQSRRKRGQSPEKIETNEPKKRMSQEFKGLVTKGGIQKRIDNSHSDWKPNDLKLLSSNITEENIGNKTTNEFQSKDKEIDIEADNVQKHTGEERQLSCTHRLINMKNIEDEVTAQLCCACHIDKAVENFIEFCSNKHDVPHEKMKILVAEWKNQDEIKNKPESSITLKETKKYWDCKSLHHSMHGMQ